MLIIRKLRNSTLSIKHETSDNQRVSQRFMVFRRKKWDIGTLPERWPGAKRPIS